MAEPRKVTLISQQGDEFEVDVAVACMSTLVKTMVEEGEAKTAAKASPELVLCFTARG